MNGDPRLWVRVNGEKKKLTYFQESTQTWEEFAIDEGTSPRLFVDSQEKIWMVPNPHFLDGLTSETPILEVFNEEAKKFITVLSVKDIPGYDPENKLSRVTISNLRMDHQNGIWFFLQSEDRNQYSGYLLFRYEPDTGKLVQHLTDHKITSDKGSSFVIIPGDIIYLLGVDGVDILQYDIQNNLVDELQIPTSVRLNGGYDLAYFSSLYLDKQNKIWLNDKGWAKIVGRIDPPSAPNWNVILQSPTFIMVQEGNGLWRRDFPTYSLDTSDGRLWYSTHNGTGWVDPAAGKWCIFSSYPSKVLQDADGHLWLIADGDLYRTKSTN